MREAGQAGHAAVKRNSVAREPARASSAKVVVSSHVTRHAHLTIHANKYKHFQEPKVVLVWSPELIKLRGHDDWANPVAFSLDGSITFLTRSSDSEFALGGHYYSIRSPFEFAIQALLPPFCIFPSTDF